MRGHQALSLHSNGLKAVHPAGSESSNPGGVQAAACQDAGRGGTLSQLMPKRARGCRHPAAERPGLEWTPRSWPEAWQSERLGRPGEGAAPAEAPPGSSSETGPGAPDWGNSWDSVTPGWPQVPTAHPATGGAAQVREARLDVKNVNPC